MYFGLWGSNQWASDEKRARVRAREGSTAAQRRRLERVGLTVFELRHPFTELEQRQDLKPLEESVDHAVSRATTDRGRRLGAEQCALGLERVGQQATEAGDNVLKHLRQAHLLERDRHGAPRRPVP
jgi:hypothetical protein